MNEAQRKQLLAALIKGRDQSRYSALIVLWSVYFLPCLQAWRLQRPAIFACR